MPTLEHNAIVEMFRETPELAPHLLAILFHVEVPPRASVAVVESALDQLLPRSCPRWSMATGRTGSPWSWRR